MPERAKPFNGSKPKQVTFVALCLASGAFIWWRILFGPILSGIEISNKFLAITKAHETLALALFLTVCLITTYLLEKPASVIFILCIILFLPLMSLALLHSIRYTFVKIYKAFQYLSNKYIVISFMIATPICHFISLNHNTPAVVYPYTAFILVVTFTFMFDLMKASENPLISIEIGVTIIRKVIEAYFFPSFLQKLLRSTIGDPQKYRRKDVVDFMAESLKILESKGFVEIFAPSLPKIAVSSFLSMFLATIGFIIINYAFIYFAVWKLDHTAFIAVNNIDLSRWDIWLSTSIAVFTTSSYMLALPGSSFARYLMMSETCCSVLIVTIFVLIFSYSGKERVPETIKFIRNEFTSLADKLKKFSEEIQSKVQDEDSKDKQEPPPPSD